LLHDDCQITTTLLKFMTSLIQTYIPYRSGSKTLTVITYLFDNHTVAQEVT
jgi:hypothetical protein